MTRAAAISKVEIERRANQARVIVHTGKPGIIIGKRGVGIDEIRRNLEKLTGKQVQVNVVEIKMPELDARLVGQNIVDQLEKRIAFRRAMKQGDHAHDEGRRARREGPGLGPPRRRGNRAHRAQPRRQGAAAHAARRHRLRARRSVHDLRPHRREGLDLQGRSAAGSAARRTPRPPGAERPQQFRENRRGTRGGRGRGPGAERPRPRGRRARHRRGDARRDGRRPVGRLGHRRRAVGSRQPSQRRRIRGAVVHDVAAEHGHGVTAETSRRSHRNARRRVERSGTTSEMRGE